MIWLKLIILEKSGLLNRFGANDINIGANDIQRQAILRR